MTRKCLWRWMAGALASAALWVGAEAARADLLVVGGVEYKDCKIQGVDGADIIFTPSGAPNSTRKEFSKVQRINIDGEAALNRAEEAFYKGDFAKSVPDYQTVIRANNAPQRKWLKLFCVARLREASDKAGDFLGAIEAIIALIQENPNAVTDFKFTMPAADSPLLPKAISLVNGSFNGLRDKKQQKLALLLLQQLNLAKGDQKAADDAMAKLAAIDPNDPIVAKAMLRKKVADIRAAVTAKKYDEALQLIEKSKDSFTEEADQADVLLCRADALAGKADPANKDACRDVALEYLRVAAAFRPETPAVPDALLRAAELLEKPSVADTDGARKLYERIAFDYKDKPQGVKAAERLKVLQPGKGG